MDAKLKLLESKRRYKQKQKQHMAALESEYHKLWEEIAALKESSKYMALYEGALVNLYDYAGSLLSAITGVPPPLAAPLPLGPTAEAIVLDINSKFWEQSQELPPSFYTIWDGLSLESMGRIEAACTRRLLDGFAEYRSCYSSRERLAPKLEISFNARRDLAKYFCKKPPTLILEYTLASVVTRESLDGACQRMMHVLRSFTLTPEQRDGIGRAWDRYMTLLMLADEEFRSVQQAIEGTAAGEAVITTMSAGASRACALLDIERRLREVRNRKAHAYLELAAGVIAELTWMQALELFATTLPRYHVNYVMVCEHVLGLDQIGGPSATNTEHDQGFHSDTLYSNT